MQSLRKPRRRILPGWLALPLCLATLPALAADKVALAPPVASLPEGSFELPNLAAAGWTQTVTGSSWTFANGGGIAANGSIWNAPAAADGDQVAIVQNGGTITQTFEPAAPGRYRITLKAAQRAGSNHTFLVRVNGVQVASVNAPGTAWTAFASSSFALTTAPASVQIAGIGTATDSSSFVEDLRLEPVSWADDAGFENAVLNSTGYNPAGSGWTFSGASGVFTAPGIWTSVAAPEGSKFALLQGNPGTRISQTVTTAAGRYMLRLYGAQRYTAPLLQTISIRIDNVEIARITPAGTSYESFRTDGIRLSAGPHLLEFVALEETPDKTAFLDQIQLVPVASAARRWSDPATWGGSLPAAGDDIGIPSGSIVLLDVNPASVPVFKSVDVESGAELHCEDTDIKLATEWMLVSGRFICGARGTPYENDFELTLAGADDNEDVLAMGMGDKFLAAMAPGVIELHGRARTSWAQLNGTVEAGGTILQLASQVNWQVGDRFVIAPTRWHINPATNLPADEAEVRTVEEINEAGTRIRVKPSLAFRHFGAQSTYSNGRSSWTLDERAQVGLLSRNITIQGDAGSSSSKYGGHMMSMAGTEVHVSGVEFTRMGQIGKLGRYPFHWHLVGDAPGQYIENSSVQESYNRCITVHGTNRTRVAGNVCYDFIGHGYFLERGDEQFNVFDANLGVLARRPAWVAAPDACVPPLETDFREAPASNGPAVFWITNPNNTFTNNVAAGSQGAGFWYHLGTQLTCLPPAGQPQPAPMNPRYLPFGKFDNNRVYASRQGLTLCHEGGGTPGIGAPGALFERTTVSSVGQGIWPCADEWWRQSATFDGSIVANTENGMQAPTPFTFTNSAFVAYTVNEPARAQESTETPWAAVRLYDQGFIFDNVHFENYNRRNMSAFLTIGGAGKLPNNRASRLSFANSPHIYRDLDEVSAPGYRSEFWGMPIHDLDGSLAVAGQAVVPPHPLLTDASCRRAAGIDGYSCPYRYAQFRFDYWPPVTGLKPPPYVTQVRSDGVQDSTVGMEGRYLVQVMADGPYYHSYRFDAGIPRNNLDLMLLNAHNGDASVHQFLDIPPDFDIHPAQEPAWTRVESLNDLLLGSGRLYFHDQPSASLFVKMQAAGETWHATDSLSLCMVNFVLVGSTWICPDGTPATPPVKTRITSPERVADFTPITVSADVTTTAPGTLDVRLFIDDGAAFLPVGSAPYTFDLGSQPPGTHVIKVVAKHTNGAGKVRSYTDLQRLIIGQPGPRLTLTSPAADGTYAPGTVPALTYTFENGPTPGQHVRWYDNGVDMGPAVGSVALGGLAPGRHDLDIALSYADGKVGSIGSRRTIYVTSNGVLADFEQGVDTRVKLRPDRDELRTVRPFYASGLRNTAYLDGGADDFNYYTTYYDATDGLRESSFLLQVTPAQDWSAYNAVEITHQGQGFEVWLRRGNAPDLQLTPSATYLPSFAAHIFAFGAADVSNVTGVELRQSVPAPPPGVNCAAVYNAHYCYVENRVSHLRLLTPGMW